MIKKTTENTTTNYEVKVERAKQIKDRRYVFDSIVNGIKIYGMWFIEYTSKEGNEGSMITFPQNKGADGKYFNVCWFPISKELKADIEAQISKLI